MSKALWSDRDGIGAMMVRCCDWTMSHLQRCVRKAHVSSRVSVQAL